MRRVIILALCTAFIVTGVGGYFAVKVVMEALAELAAGVGALLIIIVLPVLALIAFLLAGGDWFTGIELIRRLLGMLGMI